MMAIRRKNMHNSNADESHGRSELQSSNADGSRGGSELQSSNADGSHGCSEVQCSSASISSGGSRSSKRSRAGLSMAAGLLGLALMATAAGCDSKQNTQGVDDVGFVSQTPSKPADAEVALVSGGTWDGIPAGTVWYGTAGTETALLGSGQQEVVEPWAARQTGALADALSSTVRKGQDFITLDSVSAIVPDWQGAGEVLVRVYRDGPSGEQLLEQSIEVGSGPTSIDVSLAPNQRYYMEAELETGAVEWAIQDNTNPLGGAYEDDEYRYEEERPLSLVKLVPARIEQVFTASAAFNELWLPLTPAAADAEAFSLVLSDDTGNRVWTRSRGRNGAAGYAQFVTGTMPAGDYRLKLEQNSGASLPLAIDGTVTGMPNALVNGAESDGALVFALAARSDEDRELRDLYSDTWVAVDALGRTVATYDEAGAPREDRELGMFYWNWHTNWPHGPYDITKILAEDPDAMDDGDNPLWGPHGHPHHWGESIFGYYLSQDEYVLRKHAQMLSDAGVDAIYLDVTNQDMFLEETLKLFQVFQDIRNEGNNTPQIVFLTPFWDPPKVVNDVYTNIYEPGLYSDLWYMLDGKPLILADPSKVSGAPTSFFTFRKPNPSYFDGPSGPNEWSWLNIYPQKEFYNSSSELEQMSVGVAQNAINGELGVLSLPNSHGRSFNNGSMPATPYPTDEGLNFAEQFNYALQKDPKHIFVTGWNEWIAGRFSTFGNFTRPVIFVDQFNQEYSRDIEPMKGGHGDNYFYQFADFARKFKGVRPLPEATGEHTIALNDFTSWDAVTQEYRDTIGDTAHRNHRAFGDGRAGQYVNESGRNDIVRAKMAHDSDYLYAYVQTRDELTPYTDPTWMLLFLNVGANYSDGWHGYNYLVNYSVTDEDTTTLHHTSGGWNWLPVQEISYRAEGNELHVKIPLAALGLDDADSFTVDFKWHDHLLVEDDIMQFMVSGDSAPNDRYNYRYQYTEPATP